MKVLLPDHIGDIKLGQYQSGVLLDERKDLSKIEYNKRKVCIFTKLKYHELSGISMKDYEMIIEKIDKALTLSPPFQNTFDMGGREFGFIPNLDSISTAEFADIKSYEVDVQMYHKLMAILFRPIENRDALKNYSITEYHGTDEYAQAMKDMPMHLVNGAMGFFLILRRELEMSTRKSISKMKRTIRRESKQTVSSNSGIGTPVSLN